MHGKSHAEIAEETGLPLGTVKSRVRMGLKNSAAYLSRGEGFDFHHPDTNLLVEFANGSLRDWTQGF